MADVVIFPFEGLRKLPLQVSHPSDARTSVAPSWSRILHGIELDENIARQEQEEQEEQKELEEQEEQEEQEQEGQDKKRKRNNTSNKNRPTRKKKQRNNDGMFSPVSAALDATEIAKANALKDQQACALQKRRLTWWRVCLDEAQTVSNAGTATSLVVQEINARQRWCVSGTPVNNSLGDLHGLLSFLNEPHYGDARRPQAFSKEILDPFKARQPVGLRRMKAFLAKNLWRNSKDRVMEEIQASSSMAVPNQTTKMLRVQFTRPEQLWYVNILLCFFHVFVVDELWTDISFFFFCCIFSLDHPGTTPCLHRQDSSCSRH